MVQRVSTGPILANAGRVRLRRWWPWLLISAILHLPLTPLGPLFGFLTLLLRLQASVPEEPVEELLGIPVELLAEQKPEVEASPVGATLRDAVVVTQAKPKPDRKPKPEPKDAGAPDASQQDGGVDAGVIADAGPEDAGAPAALDDAGTPASDAGVADAAAPRPDPFAITGELGKFQKGNVNVRIHLFIEPLRRHPAGAIVADLLSREPQWQEFLGPGGLDPLGDFSKIIIMGPQLVDSSQVGVFLDHRGDAGAIRKAVDALVQRTDGARWETKKKKPVAYVHVAGGDRVIILYPNHGVAVVPPKTADQLIALANFPPLAVPSDDDEILQLMLRTPHRVRAFKRAGVEVPKSISLAKVFVSGKANGGARIRIELEDESPGSATAHAPDLERDIAKVTMGMFSLQLDVEDSRIHGEATLSPLIVGGILRNVQKRFMPKPSNP